MADDSHWTIRNQIPAPTPTAIALAPALDHGETDAKPSPEPRANRIRDRAAAATAPPMIADHAIADFDDSRFGSSATSAAGREVSRAISDPSVALMPEQQD